jgi:hypothetical protein
LRDVGIKREELPAIAASWDGTGPIATNPRPVRGKEDLLEILELAYCSVRSAAARRSYCGSEL